MKDPYILENGTLKNLLGITDYAELKKADLTLMREGEENDLICVHG